MNKEISVEDVWKFLEISIKINEVKITSESTFQIKISIKAN